MKRLSVIKLALSMLIFGTIGVFLRFINAERGFIAAMRGIVGALFLLVALLIMRKRLSAAAIRKNLPLLLLSGVAIGVNWILLFESYSYTTIAVSTLCYYMAPVFVILASPFVLGAKVGIQKYLSVSVSFIGMIMVSGASFGEGSNLVGILLALGAAILYASVTLMNKKISDISAYDMTIVQIGVAGLTMLPYTFVVESNDFASLDYTDLILIATVCILHTGIAYLLFFSSVKELPATTVAIFGYIDPIVAVALSLLLKEKMTLTMGVGATLIILALIGSEIDFKKLFKGTGGENDN